VKQRRLSQLILVLVLGAVVAPLAHATDPYDGYKSSYPQLHQLHSGAQAGYDGYKSSYPKLHQILSGAIIAPGSRGYDGYKSSYPQLHALLAHQVRAPLVPTANRRFAWRDAAVGAGTAAVTILLITGAALFLTRRVRVAI